MCGKGGVDGAEKGKGGEAASSPLQTLELNVEFSATMSKRH